MKPHIKYLILISCLLIISSSHAQLTITIENSQNQQYPKAKILSADFMTGDITEWGTIDANGNASFSLEYNFMEQMLLEAEQQQKDAPEGWTMSFHTVGSKHECSKFSNENSIAIENAEARMFGLPPFFVGEESTQTNHGSLYAASNSDVASWFHSYQMDDAATGFYLDWVYVEKAASVRGSCSMLTMTDHENEEINVSTTYDLNFNQGWNIVVYSIDEVFKSASERVFLTKMTVSTSDFLPENTRIFLVNEN